MSDTPKIPGTGEEPEELDELNSVLNAFTEGLKKLFHQTLEEPIPESFLELLDRLDAEWEDREE